MNTDICLFCETQLENGRRSIFNRNFCSDVCIAKEAEGEKTQRFTAADKRIVLHNIFTLTKDKSKYNNDSQSPPVFTVVGTNK